MPQLLGLGNGMSKVFKGFKRCGSDKGKPGDEYVGNREAITGSAVNLTQSLGAAVCIDCYFNGLRIVGNRE